MISLINPSPYQAIAILLNALTYLYPLYSINPPASEVQHQILLKSEMIQDEINRRVQMGYNRHIVLVHLNADTTNNYYSGDWHFLPKGCTPDLALFEIASVTKSFTAHLLILLDQDGLLCLDRPIQHYLPTSVKVPNYQGHEITLRHLLTHTSALKDPMPKADEPVPAGKILVTNYSFSDLYDYLNSAVLANRPGSCIEYSNLGYGLAAHIAELVTGKSYATLLEEKILGPLGMKHTFVDAPQHHGPPRVQGMENGMPVPAWEINDLKGFGSLISCAKDLSIYMRHIFFQSSIDELVKKAILNPYIASEKVNLSFAYGWGVDHRNDSNLFVSSGVSPGFTTFMGFNPLTQQAIILLTDSSSLDFLGHHLLNPKFPLSPLHPTIAVDPKELKKCEGTYTAKIDDTWVSCQVIASEESLDIITAGEPPIRLYPVGNKKFASKYFDISHGLIEFIFENDEQRELILHLPQKSIKLKYITP